MNGEINWDITKTAYQWRAGVLRGHALTWIHFAKPLFQRKKKEFFT